MSSEISRAQRLEQLLISPEQSVRLQAALAAGTQPTSEFIPVLVTQCRIETDFFVRDMLTWALIMNETSKVVEALIPELDSNIAQARSQALHTFSKIGNKNLFKYLKPSYLHDSSDEVARTAWRAAAGLVPVGQEEKLIRELILELGRGDFETQLSLSRTLCTLGEGILPILKLAEQNLSEVAQEHSRFTRRLFENPELERTFTQEYAVKIDTLNGAPMLPGKIS